MASDGDFVVRVVAIWRAAPGREEKVRQILRELAETTSREPGCLGFEVLESASQPGSFVLNERYASASAQQDHLASAHFSSLVLQQAVPILAHRDVQTYQVLVPDTATGGKRAHAGPADPWKGSTTA